MRAFPALVTCLGLVLFNAPADKARADIFQFTDADGVVHYTNVQPRNGGWKRLYRSDDSPYAPVYEAAEEMNRRADAMSVGPEVIARAMARAIESRRPHARYVAPFRALVALGMLKAMPSRLSDAILSRASRLSTIG